MLGWRWESAGGGVPKQYASLAGLPVLRWSLAAFARHPGVDAVRAVIHPDDAESYASGGVGARAATRRSPAAPRGRTPCGAASRRCEATPPERVLIHDAARPLVDGRDDRRGARRARQRGRRRAPRSPSWTRSSARRRGAHRGDGRPREGLWRAQTPQGFRFAAILAAHRAAAGQALTDDAAVAERAGLAVALVAGDADNLKITTDDDLARAAALLGAGETRTGTGFDVHRFGPGDHVMLCGVRIPHDAGTGRPFRRRRRDCTR